MELGRNQPTLSGSQISAFYGYDIFFAWEICSALIRNNNISKTMWQDY